MKYIRQGAIILSICFVGEVINRFFSLPVPGNVIGMLLLLFLLCTGIVKLEAIEDFSDFLLEYLPFFFLPAGVSLIDCFDTLSGNWVGFLGVIFISTIIVLISTGVIAQSIIRRKN